MKAINYKITAVFLGVFLFLGVFTSGVKAMGLLQTGSRGSQVIEVQNYLFQLNYLRTSPTGYYGRLTKEAVIAFQIEHNLAVDGVVGPKTMNILREALNGNPNSRNRPGGIQAIPWSIVNQLWKNGEVAEIMDLETGKFFQARRLYGYYHADVEPLTKEDTKIMKEVYGGKWSWDRRAVVVRIRNLYIAASINGMPHGGDSIYDNDFNGQFCAHFLGSRVHQTGRVDPLHHQMIQLAERSPFFSAERNLPELVPVMTEMEEKKIIHPRF